MSKRPLLLAILLGALAAPQARGAPPDDCSTPRKAVESLFGWLQPETLRPALAARCLEAEGRSAQQLQAAARHVKEVFDARGLYVGLDEIPEAADYKDPLTGAASLPVHPRLAEVRLVRQPDGRWLWTRASLDRVESLHRDMFALSDGLIDRIPGVLRGTFLGVQLWQYLALLLVAVIGLVVRKVIQFVVRNRLRQLVQRFGHSWGLRMAAAVDSPGATLLMAGVLHVSYPQLRLPVKMAVAMALAVKLLAAVSVVWAAYRLVEVFSEALLIRAQRTSSKLDDQLVPLVRRSLKVVTVVVGALFVLQNLDVDVGSLLAGLGIGGLAFALAAKDTLANFFGSVMIFADRPFQIGDFVVVDGAEGVVEEVGFRSTRLRTPYDSLVTLPNSKIADARVDNLGARRHRRTFFTLNLTYDTPPEQLQAFVEGVRAIILANPRTRKEGYEVHMSGFGAHSLDVMVWFFLEVPTWTDELRERHNIYLEVLRLAQALGISFAFPTQTLHHEYVAASGAARSVRPPQPPAQLARVVQAFGPGGSEARPEGLRIAQPPATAVSQPESGAAAVAEGEPGLAKRTG